MHVLQGVVTHSSGNHGGALALAAKLQGIPAHVVIPTNTPQCKIDAIAGYGGERPFQCVYSGAWGDALLARTAKLCNLRSCSWQQFKLRACSGTH